MEKQTQSYESSGLPFLKKYVYLFQTKEPLIHEIYDEQKHLFLDYFSCFRKQELLLLKSSKELISIDISNDSNHLDFE